VVSHSELTVKNKAQVLDRTEALDGRVLQHQCGGSDFSHLLASPQPDDLSLFFIQLETMAGHPVVDMNNALMQPADPWLPSA